MDKITSLQGYIEEINQNYSGNFFFRGESQDFGKTKNLASGYRWLNDNTGRKVQDLINMRCEYFRDIGAHLNSQEIENFITYAQHHGLPTELLDITENPLVALYFAVSDADKKRVEEKCVCVKEKCVCVEEKSADDAIIYIFNDNKYTENMKASNHQTQFLSDLDQPELFKLNGRNIENQYFDFKWARDINTAPDKRLMVLDDSREEHKIKSDQVDDFLISLFAESDTKSMKKAIRDEINSLYSDIDKYSNLNKNLQSSRILPVPDTRQNAKSFAKMIIPYITEFMQLKQGEYFPPLKYIHITPSIIFDRMRNQQGSFIYQLSTELEDTEGMDIRNTDGLPICVGNSVVQPIKEFASITIDADFKGKILNQLDSIGINQKFIFSDDDNVAQYYAKNF